MKMLPRWLVKLLVRDIWAQTELKEVRTILNFAK
jgi:hypothetical protein